MFSQKVCAVLVLAVAAWAPCLAAEEPLARYECAERLQLDWAPMVVTSKLELPPAKAASGNVRLVSADGAEQPVQLSRVRLHPDGSIASARVSFRTGLPASGSYSFALVRGKPAAGRGRSHGRYGEKEAAREHGPPAESPGVGKTDRMGSGRHRRCGQRHRIVC